MIKCRRKIPLSYMTHRATIYSQISKSRTHATSPKELVYENLPCFAQKISDTELTEMLGTSLIDRYRIFLPYRYEEYDPITIKSGYIINLDMSGFTATVKVFSVEVYVDRQYQIEAELFE